MKGKPDRAMSVGFMGKLKGKIGTTINRRIKTSLTTPGNERCALQSPITAITKGIY